MKIEQIPSALFTGFGRLSPLTPSDRRKMLVRDVMPTTSDIGWTMILTEAMLLREGKRIPISSFEELFRIANAREGVERLSSLRRETPLIEGATKLPDELRDLLQAATDRSHLFVRCDDCDETFFWRCSLDYLQEDLIGVLPHQTGQFFVGVQDAWLLMLKDDDPFMFLAGPKELIEAAESQCPKHLWRPPEDFPMWL